MSAVSINMLFLVISTLLYSFFQSKGYIDQKGLVQTISPFDPAKGIDKSVLMEALEYADIPNEMGSAAPPYWTPNASEPPCVQGIVSLHSASLESPYDVLHSQYRRLWHASLQGYDCIWQA